MPTLLLGGSDFELPQSFRSTSVFSASGFRQFGHRAVSVCTKSKWPCFPVTSASTQSNGISHHWGDTARRIRYGLLLYGSSPRPR